MSNMIPFIPGSAPFTAEQRAWLNGYFVGLLSTAHGENAATPAIATKSEPLLIGFGSQTGTAEQLAKRIAKESVRHGFAPQIQELNAITMETLESAPRFLIITSTWGDGDAPDNAADFYKTLLANTVPRLESLSYSVLALGDKNYSDFCGAGRKFDERLQALGGKPVLARADCDVDYEATANKWIKDLWAAFSGTTTAPTAITPSTIAEVAHETKPKWSRNNPFPARLITNRLLNGPGSAKETRHVEISLEGSDLNYEVGDALGILPRNCADSVAELIRVGGWDSATQVILGETQSISFEEALLTRLDLRKPTSALVDAIAKTEGCEGVIELLTPERKSVLQEYLGPREVIDLLYEFPAFRPAAPDFVKLLGKLQPRLYSISSSLRAFPDQVHLTVGIVRYESCGRQRKGLCSTFLADRVPEHGTVPVYIQPSHGFKLPKDPTTPIIMVGPGTGIAPFRAFLYERRVTNAAGKNWLFFGDQQAECDSLYRDELEKLQRDGFLARLDTAFSRDQKEKIYVQNRMLEHADELWKWLEAGAHFYVCGDAKRMAKDVDAALHKVVELAGRTPEQAAEYIQSLKSRKRYQRDVY
ncbi:MAG: sulfite reductase subunit alpha [Limisphaerales bacterium]